MAGQKVGVRVGRKAAQMVASLVDDWAVRKVALWAAQ